MNTLVDFITFTKGVEYLLAIAFLFAFVAVWQYTQRRGKGNLLRVLPLIAVALVIGGLALLLATQAQVTTATPQVSGEPLLTSPVLVEMYGPASFNHEEHQSLTNDCAGCHHYSEGTYPSCRECHDAPFDPENLNKPGITHVYHLRCISCHVEYQAGPVECVGCHVKAAVPALSITHPLTGNGNCLSCHQESIPGVPVVPADHDSVTNGACPICHQTVMEESAMATRQIPHVIGGYETCLLCHGEGIGEVARIPADHTGRTDETCQVCHKTMDNLEDAGVTPAPTSPDAQTEESTQAETPAETEAESVVAPNAEEEPAPAEPAGTSKIPHAVIGHEACMLCHQEGMGDAAGVPDDHTGRADETCQMCHLPAG